ncbi:MAG TPA: hypothetical protein PLZ45_07685 [Ferruginibacter sp.]|nr:hypothetical protein [Chitinophagaceae bacterium]HRI24543.1 hypothetical protein [Ferruginibacter sp.]HRI24544.1 hypothetical protein [Ferruginibacter sp.]
MKNFTASPKEHIFFSSMAVIIVALIIIGFANTYLPKITTDSHQVPGIIHLHALVFALWLAFFLFQVTLISRNKVDLHTRLGKWGVVFSLLMLAVGCAAAIAAAKAGHKGIPGVEFPDEKGFLLLNFSSIIVFILLTMLGWLNRNNPTAHKRFMLMATAGGLTPPGLARLPFIAGSTQAIAIAALVLILAGPVYDVVRYRKIHWAYLVSILIIPFSLPPVVLALSGTDIWKSIADMLTS